jgi:chromosome partitioning protein
MIIGVLNQKGGADKTTIAVNLAAVYARVGHKVLLVDADPQGSALAWSSAREADPIFTVVGMAKPTLHRDLPELAAKYDVVLIDGAPRTSGLGRAAILASDLVMIPVQPSPYDVWATAESVRPITEAQQFKTDPKAVFVIKRKIVNTAIGRDVADALAQYGFPISKASLRQRVAYAESAVNGLSVIEADPDSAGSLSGYVKELEMFERPAWSKKIARSEQAAAVVKPMVKPMDEPMVEPIAAPAEPMKRFTIDVPVSLHTRVKTECAKSGRKMADVVRDLLERQFPAGS